MSEGSATSTEKSPPPLCDCKIRAPTRLRTSWTKYNPGRRFWGCHNYGLPGACGFFAWYDQPTCSRGMQILPRLLDRSNMLEKELALYQDREVAKELNEAREVRQARELNEAREVRQARELNEAREVREARELKERQNCCREACLVVSWVIIACLLLFIIVMKKFGGEKMLCLP